MTRSFPEKFGDGQILDQGPYNPPAVIKSKGNRRKQWERRPFQTIMVETVNIIAWVLLIVLLIPSLFAWGVPSILYYPLWERHMGGRDYFLVGKSYRKGFGDTHRFRPGEARFWQRRHAERSRYPYDIGDDRQGDLGYRTPYIG